MVSEKRIAVWRERTGGHMPLLVPGLEDERRRLVDSAVTDGVFQLSPVGEQGGVLGIGEVRRRGSAGF